MATKMLMIAGLKKQHDLLEDLLGHFEEKPQLDAEDQFLCTERTRLIEGNLKKLRRLQKTYCFFITPQSSSHPIEDGDRECDGKGKADIRTSEAT